MIYEEVKSTRNRNTITKYDGKNTHANVTFNITVKLHRYRYTKLIHFDSDSSFRSDTGLLQCKEITEIEVT